MWHVSRRVLTQEEDYQDEFPQNDNFIVSWNWNHSLADSKCQNIDLLSDLVK